MRVLLLGLNLRENHLWIVLILNFFLSKLEQETFTLGQKPLRYSYLFKDEYQTVRSLDNDWNIVIKKGRKGSYLESWDHSLYVMEAEKKLNDKAIYKDVTFNKNNIPNLTEKSNKILAKEVL